MLVVVDDKLLLVEDVTTTRLPPVPDSELGIVVVVVTLFASKLLISADGFVVVDEIVPDWFMMVVVPVVCWGGCGGATIVPNGCGEMVVWLTTITFLVSPLWFEFSTCCSSWAGGFCRRKKERLTILLKNQAFSHNKAKRRNLEQLKCDQHKTKRRVEIALTQTLFW